MLLLDTFTERDLYINAVRFCNLCYRGCQKSPKHVLSFRSLKFKENVCISLVSVGFYIYLCTSEWVVLKSMLRYAQAHLLLPLFLMYTYLVLQFQFLLCCYWYPSLASLKEIHTCLNIQSGELG